MAKSEAKKIYKRKLFYGDNLDVLRNAKYIASESVDLVYIDPPFNSKRNYNQIYNNIGREDKAQAQAFVDTWTWDEEAIKGFDEIQNNIGNRFSKQTIQLIIGFEKVLGKGSLMAYLVSMTLRVVEIHRVLKNSGSFYFHCDPTASHYLKVMLDSVFCANGGDYRNEIIWKRINAKGLAFTRFASNHDVIFYYSKSKDFKWKPQYKAHDEKYITDFYKYKDADGRVYRLGDLTNPNKNRPNLTYEFLGIKRVWRWTKERMQDAYEKGIVVQTRPGAVPSLKRYLDEQEGTPIDDIWIDILPIQSQADESLGYPTQKPESLLERIINASTDKGDVVLDAYCGCGTTVSVAEKLQRNWIGIDITYQSISLILKRLEDSYGKEILKEVDLNGVPQDFDSAEALANKSNDKTRKEFEKWCVLTYSNNRAIINEKKGADGGIDGTAFINDFERNGVDVGIKQIIFSVKSDKKPHTSYLRDLNGVLQREEAVMGYFITLYPPTKDMIEEAKKLGKYKNSFLGKDYDRIKIVTVQEILNGNVFEVPKSHEIAVVKSAKRKEDRRGQGSLELD